MFDNDVRFGSFTKTVAAVLVPAVGVAGAYAVNAAARVYGAAEKSVHYAGKVAEWENKSGWKATRKISYYTAKVAKWSAKEASRYDELYTWSTALMVGVVVTAVLIYANREKIREMYQNFRQLNVLPS